MVSPGRGQLPSRRRDHRSKSVVKIKISAFLLFLDREKSAPTLPAGSRLNYALKGSLTVINEEFYTVDRTPTSIGLLLNEYNYNLPSLSPLCFPPRYSGLMTRVKNPAWIPIERSILRSSGEAPVRSRRNERKYSPFRLSRSSVNWDY